MFAEHFWKLVFVAAALAAAFFYWRKWDGERRLQVSTSELAALIDPAAYPPSSSESAFEKAVFMAIGYLHEHAYADAADSEAADKELSRLVTAAASANGLDEDYGTTLMAAFRDLIETCDELGVFDDPRNLSRLSFGNEPEIQRGPYEGEDLVIVPGLSPIVAEEARNQFVNVALVPRPVRSLTDETVTAEAYEYANRLRDIGVLTDGHFDRVKLLQRASGERR
jgi:hypothetical protein